jgi:uncharacterized surface protein with fasciclin (FAS1) repeats
MTKLKLYNLILLFCLVAASACKDKYGDDHFKKDSGAASLTLLAQIQSKAELSQFANYLSKTGYDTVLASSKLYTVWAPTNDAVASVDGSILNNSIKLKTWVANHICVGAYFTQTPDSSLTIYRLSNKALKITKNSLSVNGATIVTPDLVCTNGVLQVINKSFPLLPNIWEYFSGSSLAPKFGKFLLNYNYLYYDFANSKVVGVNAAGQNVYDTVKLVKNKYLTSVNDLTDETVQYTFFMLTDNAYDNLSSRYRNYYLKSTVSATDSVTNWATCQDMVVSGKYTTLPDTLISTTNVKIPIDKSSIKGSFEASNGVVYVLDNCPVRLKDKIKPVIVEGESPDRFYTSIAAFNVQTVNTAVINAMASGNAYLKISGHNTNTPNLGVGYNTNLASSVQYNISWVCPNRSLYLTATLTTGITSQALKILSGANILKINTTVSGVTAPRDSAYAPQTIQFTEVSLGNITFSTAGTYTLRVHSSQANPIFLDYIKMVPVLP